MKTTLNFVYLLLWNLGGIYSHQGRGPGGQPLAQNVAAAADVRPQKRGPSRVFATIQWLRVGR